MYHLHNQLLADLLPGLLYQERKGFKHVLSERCQFAVHHILNQILNAIARLVCDQSVKIYHVLETTLGEASLAGQQLVDLCDLEDLPNLQDILNRFSHREIVILH